MNIGGFSKNTLIDFPQTIACIVFTQGCNFFCPYCHNPDLVAGPHTTAGAGGLFDEQKIMDYLKQRQGLLEGVVITGGEPTLQKDLKAFCRTVKNLGYKIKLDTNGSRPDILEDLLASDLLDFVSMDIKTSLDRYDRVVSAAFDTQKISKSIQRVMETAPAYEFRTTCSRPFVTPGILEKIGVQVQGADQYILAKCSRNVKVLDSDFVKSDNHFFSDAQMMELKETLTPFVKKVIVR